MNPVAQFNKLPAIGKFAAVGVVGVAAYSGYSRRNSVRTDAADGADTTTGGTDATAAPSAGQTPIVVVAPGTPGSSSSTNDVGAGVIDWNGTLDTILGFGSRVLDAGQSVTDSAIGLANNAQGNANTATKQWQDWYTTQRDKDYAAMANAGSAAPAAPNVTTNVYVPVPEAAPVPTPAPNSAPAQAFSPPAGYPKRNLSMPANQATSYYRDATAASEFRDSNGKTVKRGQSYNEYYGGRKVKD